jgi:hypothetical protein
MSAATKAPAESGGQMVKSGEPPRAPAPRATENGAMVQAGSVTELLQLAIEKGTPVEQLTVLVDLHERLSNRAAAVEFAQAMAAFQAECPPIHKSSTAKIATQKGGQYSYTYAELDEIARTINPILAKFGLSYSWDSAVDDRGQILTCTCTVRHLNGHSVTSKFTLPIENPSAMNPQQKVAAALTFAKRQTLTSALGLTTTDEDPDSVKQVDPTPVSEDQLIQLEDLVTETQIDLPRFLKYLEISALKDLPAARFKEAVAALNEKKQRKAGK